MATYRMSESLGNCICVYNCMSVLDLLAELRIIKKVADVCRSRCFEQARASSFRTVPGRRMTVKCIWLGELWQSLMDTMLTYKLALNRLLGCFWSFTKTARLVRILRFLTEQLIHSFGFGEFRRQYSLTYGCSKTNKDWPWMSAAGLQICPWSPRVVAEIARGSKPRLLIICDEGIEVFLQEWVVRMVVVRMTGPLGLYFGD